MNYCLDVNFEKVQKDGENYFRNGFYCCEAVVAAIIDNFKLDVSKNVISVVSGMAKGIGSAGCVCGALNGAIAALGLFFGRCEPTGPKDPKIIKCLELSNEMHQWFKENNGKHCVCCRALTKEFDMSKGEHKEQCIYFTGLCARKVAEIIKRELENA